MRHHNPRQPAVGVLTAILAAACASAPTAPIPAVGANDDLEIDYEANVASGIWSPGLDDQVGETDLSKVETFIDVAVSFVELDSDQVEELLGEPRMAPWAISADRAAAKRAIDRLAGDAIARHQLMIADGQRGTVLIANQIAYVERFDVAVSRSVSIADPIIGVANEGLLLDILGAVVSDSPGTDAVHLELALHDNKLHRPLHRVEVELPGTSLGVTIQQPVTSSQTLRVSLALRSDKLLVIGIPTVGETDSILVAFITCRPIARAEFAPQEE